MKACRMVYVLAGLILLFPGILHRMVAGDLAVLTGRITDSQGLVVPNVKVQATNVDTNITYSGESNGDGLYRISEIPPGLYRVLVQKTGFVQILKPDVQLHVQDDITLNFSMRLGSISETVTVQSGAPLVNTSSAVVGTVIDRNFVSQLPLNGRSFNTLLQLTPGAVIAPADSVASPGQFSINGQRTNANYFQVDGVGANFGISTQSGVTGSYQNGGGGTQAFNAVGGTNSLVSVDAMQEFRVETSSFAPEYGHTPGGQVIIETRSGTNDFHGGIFDYFRNTAMDANNWFSNAANPQVLRAPEHQNDFGGFVGGPVWKSKTFFFFSYEGLRLLQPQTSVITVPSQLARTSAVSAAGPYIDAFPEANGRADLSNPYVAQFTGSYDNRIAADATSIRIDHLLTSKWSLFGRYNFAPSSLIGRTRALNETDTTKVNTTTLTIGVTGFLTPRITDSFRANYSVQRGGQTWTLDSFGGNTPLNADLLLPTPLSSGTSVASFALIDLTSGYFEGTPSNNHQQQFNFLNNLDANVGQHEFKVGVDYRRLTYFQSGLQAQIFSTGGTVQDFASTGQIDRLFYFVVHPSNMLFDFWSFYGQDTWKVNSRITLTYGLRWELNPPPTGTGNTQLSAWKNTETPGETVLASLGTPLWSTRYNNFAPRVGVAYKPTSSDEFVLRAGWGVFYDLGTGIVASLGSSYPNSGFSFLSPHLTLPLTDVTQYAPAISSQPPYPGASAFSSHLVLPRSYQWNVALEKSFRGKQTVSATYVGQLGRDLLRTVVEFQPNANFAPGGSLQLTANGDSSDYEALQLQYRRPMTQNLQALVNYTWSHCLDTNSQDNSPVGAGMALPPHGDRGSCDFDVRHNFTGAVSYNEPRLFRHAALDQILGHWSLDSVVQFRTGFPINVVYDNFAFNSSPFTALRPDIVATVPVWLMGPQCIAQFGSCPGGRALNPAAFDSNTPQNEGRQGNLGRNAIPGFGAAQVDLSLMRNFPITDKISLQFRADTFNLFNHPNFYNPDSNLSDGTLFGPSSQMLGSGLGGLTPLYQLGGPRSVQASLRLLF
jgi:hypothetical protein